ncbi:MAG: hypothetical protein LUG99_10780 [Lachnospiraceae bacterium]|nr:hypothetical protein [Lachnospiraceae bacterium]
MAYSNDLNGKSNKKTAWWSELPPEERPAVGETVEVIRGKFKGYRGTVKGTVPRGVQIEVSQGSLQGTITVMRHLLKDADGKLMPEIISEEEARRREEHRKLVEERAIQADRMYEAVSSKGHDFWQYCKDMMGLHSSEISDLLDGEMDLDEYMLDELENNLGVGRDWILHGDERCKEHTCSEKMRKYLNTYPEKREIVWNWMQDDNWTDEDDFV